MTIINILLSIALLIFISYNVYEIYLANKFYKRIEKEHMKEIDDLIDKIVEDKLGDE